MRDKLEKVSPDQKPRQQFRRPRIPSYINNVKEQK